MHEREVGARPDALEAAQVQVIEATSKLEANLGESAEMQALPAETQTLTMDPGASTSRASNSATGDGGAPNIEISMPPDEDSD